MKAKVNFLPPGLEQPIEFIGTVLGESATKDGYYRISDGSVVYDVPVGQFRILREEPHAST